MTKQFDTHITEIAPESAAEQIDTLQTLDLDQLAQVGGGGFVINE